MEISDFLAILNRRKWVVILTALMTILVVIAGTQLISPTYQATATLRIATASTGSTNYNDYMYADRLINTYIKIATSKPLLDKLNKELSISKTLNIVVEAIPNTELIQITVEDHDPNLAMKAANALGSILIAQSSEFYGGGGKSPSDILKTQVDQALSELNQDRTNYNNFVLKNPDDQAGIQAAAKTVDLQQQIYSSLLSQYEQMRTQEAIQANIISVTDPAVFPTSPSKPNKPLNIAIGVVVGLIGGFGLAFLFENLDTTLYTSKEIREVTPFNPIGQIPSTSKKEQRHFPLDRNSPFNEAFIRLRTNLLALINDQPIRTLMVTSALQGEGKTTVAANFAYALSQSGKKVLLLDCDLRLPRVAQLFRAQNELGLSEYLSGEIDVDKAIHKTKFTDLLVMAAGKVTDESAILLDSIRMKDLFPTLLEYFDFVVIDTPAVLAVNDASVIAPLVDGVLLVVKRGFIRREKLEATLEQMANVKAKIIGLVINRSEYTDHYYHYNYKKNKLKGE